MNKSSETADKKNAPPLGRESLKDWISITQGIATIAALAAAAWWFFFQEEQAARINVTQAITHRTLTPDWTLIFVSVSLTNVGKRPVALGDGLVRVQQVLPLADPVASDLKSGNRPIRSEAFEVDWPFLDKQYQFAEIGRLSVGESGTFDFEFFVPSYVKTIKIYTQIQEATKKTTNDGWVWTATNLYDVQAARLIQPLRQLGPGASK